MNKSTVDYIGRPSRRIPTKKHLCLFNRIARVKGNRIRMGCGTCPSLDYWDKAEAYTPLVQEMAHQIRESRKRQSDVPVYGYAPPKVVKGKRARGHIQDAGSEFKTADWSWKVDNEGRTPDETVMHSMCTVDSNDGCLTDPEIDTHDDALGSPEQYAYDPKADAAESRNWGSVAKDEAADRIRKALGVLTKDEIFTDYPNYGLKKSWTKMKMIDVIIEQGLKGD